MYNHPRFTTAKSFWDRLEALPAHVVYEQLTGRPEWGEKMHNLVPEHMRQGFVVWAAFGNEELLGGFMRGLLENNLMQAFTRADYKNTAAMGEWVRFLHNYVPSRCYGSKERVKEWSGMLIPKKEAADENS